MAKNLPLTHDSLVRDLPYTSRRWLSQKLNPLDSWEDLAASIPLNHEDLLSQDPVQFDPRYETHNMFVFKRMRDPTIGLLEDWEMENCRIMHLIQALSNAKLFDAAKYISEQCIQPVPSLLQEPPQQPVANSGHRQQQPTTEDTEIREDVLTVDGCGVQEAKLKAVPPQSPIEDCLQGNDVPDKASDDIHQMPAFNFELLRRITGNFDTREKTQGGNLIGTGGFGDVFFGEFFGHKLAVKRLKENNENSLKQFETELKTLCAYKHENVVALMGSCSDGNSLCLVYEYVLNGSLEDRLACVHGSTPLSVVQRLEIARGTARGIHYLHGNGVTHRDIKTANVLLDENYKPKVSDFATARTSPKSVSKDIIMDAKTREIIGTSFYLAPEAHDYIIHPALDVYSFGVVILELITGLPVYDPDREEEDLKVHVREHCAQIVRDDDDDDEDGTIFDLLDKRPGVNWDPALVEQLYDLSKNCLERRKKRKTIKEVLKTLNDVTDLYAIDGGDSPEK